MSVVHRVDFYLPLALRDFSYVKGDCRRRGLSRFSYCAPNATNFTIAVSGSVVDHNTPAKISKSFRTVGKSWLQICGEAQL